MEANQQTHATTENKLIAICDSKPVFTVNCSPWNQPGRVGQISNRLPIDIRKEWRASCPDGLGQDITLSGKTQIQGIGLVTWKPRTARLTTYHPSHFGVITMNTPSNTLTWKASDLRRKLINVRQVKAILQHQAQKANDDDFLILADACRVGARAASRKENIYLSQFRHELSKR